VARGSGEWKAVASSNKITIKDVARMAGVSTQTVSRVLNNRPDVSVATRARVQQVIAELGYAPNVFARFLSRGWSNTLGVVGYGLRYFGPASVLVGIEGKADELGFSLTLSLLEQVEPTRVDRVLYEQLSHRVEGIIWAVPGDVNTLDWLAEKFTRVQIPTVFINKGQKGGDCIAALDNRLGGRLATEHLLAQGYQQVGIITGPEHWWETRERLSGWRHALEACGCAPADSLVAVGDWTPASGDAGLQVLLERNPGMDAVFASNDQMALGALRAAQRHRLAVPDDLGVIGFDDIPEAAYFYPSLSTVRQDAWQLGALAVKWIDELIQAQRAGEKAGPGARLLEPQLVPRNSSARK